MDRFYEDVDIPSRNFRGGNRNMNSRGYYFTPNSVVEGNRFGRRPYNQYYYSQQPQPNIFQRFHFFGNNRGRGHFSPRGYSPPSLVNLDPRVIHHQHDFQQSHMSVCNRTGERNECFKKEEVRDKAKSKENPQKNPEAAKKEAFANELRKSLRNFQKKHSQSSDHLLIQDNSTDTNRIETTPQSEPCFPWDLPLTVDDLKTIGRGTGGDLGADSCSEDDLNSLNLLRCSKVNSNSPSDKSPEVLFIKQCRKRQSSESAEVENKKRKVENFQPRRRHRSASPNLCEEVTEIVNHQSHLDNLSTKEIKDDNCLPSTSFVETSTSRAIPSLTKLLGLKRRELSEMVEQPRNPRVQFMLRMLMKRHKELLLQRAIRSRYSAINSKDIPENSEGLTEPPNHMNEIGEASNSLQGMGASDTIDELSNILLESSLTVDISSLPQELIDQLGTFLEMGVDLGGLTEYMEEELPQKENPELNGDEMNRGNDEMRGEITSGNEFVTAREVGFDGDTSEASCTIKHHTYKELNRRNTPEKFLLGRVKSEVVNDYNDIRLTSDKSEYRISDCSSLHGSGDNENRETDYSRLGTENQKRTSLSNNENKEPDFSRLLGTGNKKRISSSKSEIKKSSSKIVNQEPDFSFLFGSSKNKRLSSITEENVSELGSMTETSDIQSVQTRPVVEMCRSDSVESCMSSHKNAENVSDSNQIVSHSPLQSSSTMSCPSEGGYSEEEILAKMWEIDQNIGKLIEEKHLLYEMLNKIRSEKNKNQDVSISSEDSSKKSSDSSLPTTSVNITEVGSVGSIKVASVVAARTPVSCSSKTSPLSRIGFEKTISSTSPKESKGAKKIESKDLASHAGISASSSLIVPPLPQKDSFKNPKGHSSKDSAIKIVHPRDKKIAATKEDKNKLIAPNPEIGDSSEQNEPPQQRPQKDFSKNPKGHSSKDSAIKIVNPRDKKIAATKEDKNKLIAPNPEIGNSSEQNETPQQSVTTFFDFNKHRKELAEKEYIGHKDTIIAIQLFEKYIFASCADFCVYCYKLKSCEMVMKFRGHTKNITCLHVQKRNSKAYLYTGSHDEKLLRFNSSSGQLLETKMVDEPIQCMKESWDILFIGTKGGLIEKYSLTKFNFMRPAMVSLKSEIMAIDSSKEGPRRVLIIATRDKPIIVRDAYSGLLLRAINEGVSAHTVFTIQVYHGLVYAGTNTFGLTAWDFHNGHRVKQYAKCGTIVALKIIGKRIYAASYDGHIYVYDIEVSDPKLVIKVSDKMLLSLAVRDDKVYSSSLDRKLRCWTIPRLNT